MKRGVVFNSDHLENSVITSQNVMDLLVRGLERGHMHPPHIPAWLIFSYFPCEE